MISGRDKGGHSVLGSETLGLRWLNDKGTSLGRCDGCQSSERSPVRRSSGTRQNSCMAPGNQLLSKHLHWFDKAHGSINPFVTQKILFLLSTYWVLGCIIGKGETMVS